MHVEQTTRVFPGIEEVPEARLEVLIGRLKCADMRDLLESEVFAGRPIRWHEGKGWIERRFTIVGPPAHIEQVRERLAMWFSVLQQLGSM